MQYHCTEQFWFKFDPDTNLLTRHVYDTKGTICLPLTLRKGLELKSPPVFLGGITGSMPHKCVTKDLEWIIDLNTMRACRLCQFDPSLGVQLLASCPRANHFLALLKGKALSPIMHIHNAQLHWLPEETRYVTRAMCCDLIFEKVALYMTHTKQLCVWNRLNKCIERFARCPAVADFITCCHTHRIFAITYENPQRMITFCTDEMIMVKDEVIAERQGRYGRLYPNPCYSSQNITPYVSENDEEKKRWIVGDVHLSLENNIIKKL